MSPRTWFVAAAFVLGACSATKPAPEIPLDEAVPAQRVADPAPPTQIIEVPKAIPFPNQLKFLPELSEPEVAASPTVGVNQANVTARVEPTPSGFINAVQVWPYTPGALYQLYTTPGKVTDIALEPGEDIVDISAPDSVRWIIGDTRSGSGAGERRHVIVKPIRVDLQANLVIFTSRRTYHLELKSTPETWMAAVSWEYPTDNLLALKAANRERQAAAPIDTGIALDDLHFRYDITGDKPAWRPLRAFDDGRKVYIQFPDAIAQGEMPPLFVIGADGDTQLVNFRVRAPYYIVDRLFGAAELRLGARRAQVVRIARTDVVEKRRQRGRFR